MSLTSAQLQRAKRKLARKSYLDFVTYVNPEFKVEWYHELLAEKLQAWAEHKITRLIITLPPRHGKALTLDTPILTPDRGFVPMGDLKAGDQVFGRDGLPCNVVGRSPVWKDRKVFQVRGTSVVADEAHEWQYESCRKSKSERIAETRHLSTLKRAKKVYRSPALSGFDYREPAVDPYTLGIWLGDGHAQSGTTFFSGDQDRAFVRSQIPYETTNRSEANSFGVVGGFHTALREMGLLSNKHFKNEWLLWAPEDRLALLQGLIDSDGYVAEDGQIEFCNTNKSLAEGVERLVWTLGVRASMSEGRATLYGKDCGPKYRTSFYMAEAARIPRKAKNCRNASKSNDFFLRFDELEERRDTVCIEVDGPDHLFLAGYELIPTRNTELAARNLPAWIFGINPDAKILAASGEQDLANANSRDVQRILKSPEYEEVFPNVVLSGKQREDLFEINERGVYQARSTGSGLSGRGADHFIIDDYFGSQSDAFSAAKRQTLWDWYNSDALKRLHYPSSILVMATRWHHDDLIGRLLDSPDADDYEVVEIPKICDWPKDEQPAYDPRAYGEPLLSPANAYARHEYFPDQPVPEKMRKHAVIISRDEVSSRVKAQAEKDKAREPYAYWALDQCRPTPREGGLFTTENFVYGHSDPGGLSYDELMVSVDPSLKGSEANDPMAALVIGRRGQKYYLVDMVHGRYEFPEAVQLLKQLLARYPKAFLLVEEKAAGSPIIQTLRKNVGRVIGFNPTKWGDKHQRANYASQAYASAQIIHPARKYAHWIGEFEDELKKFPGAAHDDQVDALSQAVIYWDQNARRADKLKKTLRIIEGAVAG